MLLTCASIHVPVIYAQKGGQIERITSQRQMDCVVYRFPLNAYKDSVYVRICVCARQR